LSTKSLLLASVAYIGVGVVAGGLLANSTVLSSAPGKIQEAAATVARTVTNKEAKHDRLVMQVNFSARVQENVADSPLTTGNLPPSTLSAYAALPPAANEKVGPPVPWAGQAQSAAPAKPKQAVKHQPTYAILSDEQIASVKERMKLTPFQAEHWPAIEAALRKIAAKLNRSNAKGGGEVTAASIDPDSQEVQDLKTAAMPLLFTLNEDQKREVRTLARVIGLDAVASAI
jgi:hypothetical protein